MINKYENESLLKIEEIINNCEKYSIFEYMILPKLKIKNPWTELRLVLDKMDDMKLDKKDKKTVQKLENIVYSTIEKII